MSKLPEKFPEYSIMYKTLSKQIKELKKREYSRKRNTENTIKDSKVSNRVKQN